MGYTTKDISVTQAQEVARDWVITCATDEDYLYGKVLDWGIVERALQVEGESKMFIYFGKDIITLEYDATRAQMNDIARGLKEGYYRYMYVEGRGDILVSVGHDGCIEMY